MKHIILFVLPLICLLSCSDETMEDKSIDYGNGKSEIVFTTGFQNTNTRVSTDNNFKSTFEVGDAIGLFAVKRDKDEAVKGLQTSGNHYHNVKLTLNDAGVWIPNIDINHAPAGEVLDFYAYYPYNSTVTDPSNIAFRVETKQNLVNNGVSNYDKSELLASDPVEGVNKEDEEVILNFSHQLSMIYVDVPRLETNGVKLKGVGPRETLEIYVPNIHTGGKYDLVTQSMTLDEQQSTISMYRIEKEGDENYSESYTYRALVPSQELDATISYHQDGRDYQLELHKTELLQGYAKKITLTMPMSSIHTNLIKAGTFLMGSPIGEPGKEISDKGTEYEPQHKVQLTKNYRISIYTITAAQYAWFLNEVEANSDGESSNIHHSGLPTLVTGKNSASYEKLLTLTYENGKWKAIAGRENLPAVRLSWIGADEYAYYMNANLPSEAQWEYACRAGNSTPFGLGDGKTLTGDMANINGKEPYSLDLGGIYTDANGMVKGDFVEVGSYEPNAWGIYDMHGNVSELCADEYDINYGLSVQQLTEEITVDPLYIKNNEVLIPVVKGGLIETQDMGNDPYSIRYRSTTTQRSAARSATFRVITHKLIGFRIVY